MKALYMLIEVKMKPKSRRAQIKKIDETRYEVMVDAEPEKGKANSRLIEILSDYFKIKRSAITIVKGNKSRNKIVEIASD